MPSYLVVWTIDIDADTPEEAARAAQQIQRNPNSIATVFLVRNESGDHWIDLLGENDRGT